MLEDEHARPLHGLDLGGVVAEVRRRGRAFRAVGRDVQYVPFGPSVRQSVSLGCDIGRGGITHAKRVSRTVLCASGSAMRSLNRVILHNRRGGSIGGGRGRGHGVGGGIWMRALDGASGCLPSPHLAFMLPPSRLPLSAVRAPHEGRACDMDP